MKKKKKATDVSKRYGRLKRERIEPRDAVDDLKVPFGYKLMKGWWMNYDDREIE